MSIKPKQSIDMQSVTYKAIREICCNRMTIKRNVLYRIVSKQLTVCIRKCSLKLFLHIIHIFVKLGAELFYFCLVFCS